MSISVACRGKPSPVATLPPVFARGRVEGLSGAVGQRPRRHRTNHISEEWTDTKEPTRRSAQTVMGEMGGLGTGGLPASVSCNGAGYEDWLSDFAPLRDMPGLGALRGASVFVTGTNGLIGSCVADAPLYLSRECGLGMRVALGAKRLPTLGMFCFNGI